VDRRGYEQALRPLLTRAAGYAHAVLRHRQDAEDAVQQAALRGFERIATYQPSRPFKGWWFTILHNCCMDLLRKRGAQVFIDPELPQSDREEEWRRLEAAFERLPPAQHEILRLRYFGELSYEELAETLAIPKGTVMSRLHTARKALAALVQEEVNEAG
jgi:RNA polymerase sigma-70 factor (ECF subfamily)